MSALGHINMLVKCSGSSLPSARSGAVSRTSKAEGKPGSAGRLTPANKGDYEYVYDFYRDVAPAIRMRELGVSSLSKYDADAFASLSSIPVYMSKLPKGTGGRHIRSDDGTGSKRIELPDDKAIPGFELRKTLAHELRHALARKMKPAARSASLLDSIYGFLRKGVDIKPNSPGYHQRMSEEEMFTSNKEGQYRIYEALRDKLKRPPTADEYFRHIDEMPRYELYNHRKHARNKYMEIADRILGGLRISRGIEKYREALKSISMSRNPGYLEIGHQGKGSRA